MTALVTLAAIDKASLETWLNATLETTLNLTWTNGESAQAVIDGTICDLFHDADWCNIAFNGPAEARLKGAIEAAILTPGTTGQITATRGTLTWPKTASGPALAFPASPSHGFAGVPVQPAPEVEVVTPLDAIAEWGQRTPGVQDGYRLNETAIDEGRAYIVDDETNASGNYFKPSAPNSGWLPLWAPGQDEPDWEPWLQYVAGQIVRGGDPAHRFEALIDEFSLDGREPWNPVMQAVWEDLGPVVVDPGMEAWAPGTNYLAGGEERAHAGEEWINIRANNTQQLAPGTDGSGWLRKSNRPAPWYSVGSPWYPLTLDGSDMRTTSAGRVWRNTSANNSFAPGVFGWVDEGPA